MNYIYCPRRSNGALELVKALGFERLRRFDGLDFWDKNKRFKLVKGDVIVCWGSSVPDIEGIMVLNSSKANINKYQELEQLLYGNVPTIKVYGGADKNLANNLLLPRKVYHQGGKDLLVTPDLPDFYVFKENFAREFRLHTFSGKSIRAGLKVPREGFTPVLEGNWKPNSNLLHPWVRSFDAGWKINYDGFVSTEAMRKLAKKALGALGLTFGAVDLGETPEGKLLVLEVNRSPGIEGNTITAYARAITKWVEKGEVNEAE